MVTEEVLIQMLQTQNIFNGSKEQRVKNYELVKASSILIVKHIKIRGDANPFDRNLGLSKET